jgi:hypothetical protein
LELYLKVNWYSGLSLLYGGTRLRDMGIPFLLAACRILLWRARDTVAGKECGETGRMTFMKVISGCDDAIDCSHHTHSEIT